jgi:RNA polymerase sigma factor (sigma-70 family)
MDDQRIREETTMTNIIAGSKHYRLAQELEESHDELLTSIRVLIWKMGMASSHEEADSLSHEILNETIITAINIEDRYNAVKSMRAWLLGIATNKIRELRTKEARRGKRVGTVAETYQYSLEKSKSAPIMNKDSERITEDEMIDYLNARNTQDNPLDHKIHISFAELISLVGPGDQKVLKLAFQDNLKGNDLAATLKLSDGAANVRLSRAISRLRQAYLASEASERSENE